MYLTLTTFADLWTLKYHMSVGIGSLNYIPLGLGIYFGAMVSNNTFAGDWLVTHKTPHSIVLLSTSLAQRSWIAHTGH